MTFDIRQKMASGATLALLIVVLGGCAGEPSSDKETTPTPSSTPSATPTLSATPDPSQESPSSDLRLVGPAEFDFALGGACPQLLVTDAHGDATSFVVSGADSSVEEWTPQFSGHAAQDAESDRPIFTAGVTSSGTAFVLAALVVEHEGVGALDANTTQLEFNTLDVSSGQPLGPPTAIEWEASEEVPDLPPCVGSDFVIQMNAIGAGPANQPVAVGLDLESGKTVFSEALAVAANTSAALYGTRVLATFASTYDDVQRLGPAPVASMPLPNGSSKVVIGGNAFDYAYFGVDPVWIPGIAGGDKQPTSTSGQAYESYTFPASCKEPFVTDFATVGSVSDFYDPQTKTKLMVVTDLDGGASAIAGINYETGAPSDFSWFPKNPEQLDFHIYGFYDGRLWVTSKGRALVLTVDGDEVSQAEDWVTYPQYAGEGWAVLRNLNDAVEGVAFPGSFDPKLTTLPLDDLE